jgi:hypothetical protein
MSLIFNRSLFQKQAGVGDEGLKKGLQKVVISLGQFAGSAVMDLL